LGVHFEEDLMTRMANHGQGRAYYGEDAEDLMGPFMEEFELLSDLFAPELVLRLEAAPGVQIRVMNPYPALGLTGWALPSLPFAGEAWALAQVTVGAEAMATLNMEGRVMLLRPALEWKGRDGVRQTLESEDLVLPVLSESVFAALPESPEVKVRLRDLKVAELEDAIYQMALNDDWEGSRRLLDELKALAGDEESLQNLVSNMEDLAKRRDSRRLAKEARFGSNFISTSSQPIQGPDYLNEAELKPYFRRKSRFGKQEPPTPPKGSGAVSSSVDPNPPSDPKS
jgi:hypothetical protein